MRIWTDQEQSPGDQMNPNYAGGECSLMGTGGGGASKRASAEALAGPATGERPEDRALERTNNDNIRGIGRLWKRQTTG